MPAGGRCIGQAQSVYVTLTRDSIFSILQFETGGAGGAWRPP